MVTFFKNIKQSKGGQTVELQKIINGIFGGKWEDSVLKVRAELEKTTDKKKRGELKGAFPNFTTSGIFTHRQDSKIIEHSGYIAIDFDNIKDLEGAKKALNKDKYTWVSFLSISGKGLCVIVKIDGSKHRGCFKALEEYYADTYGYIIDSSCINEARVRYISYDPNLYQNKESKIWVKVKAKKKILQKYTIPFIATNEKIGWVIGELCDRGVNLCELYEDWLKVAASLCAEFGENGRDYFHALSQQSTKYDSDSCDIKYDKILKEGSKISIAYIMSKAKESGIDIRDNKTSVIAQTASFAKKARNTKQGAAEILEKMQGIPKKDSMPIIEKVFASNQEIETDVTYIEKLKIYINANYSFRINEITRRIDDGNKDVDTKYFNSVYVQVQQYCDEKIGFEKIERLINSDFTPTYNPLLDFINENKELAPEGKIKALAECIKSDMPQEYVHTFVKKWIVSVISAIHYEYSPLMLVLTGQKQGTGKTEFFRRLLPKEISSYYAESKLDRDKDDEILMTQKLIIMDDEFGGKSKKEATRFKELTSKSTFSLREPYGKNNIDLKRLAVLCGTSNDTQILNDPTGNRRVIPIHVVEKMDYEKYNAIDKTELLMEAYHLWESGFDWRVLDKDIEVLNKNTEEFQAVSSEKELILSYFALNDLAGYEQVQIMNSEIKSIIEKRSQQKITSRKLGQELKAMGLERECIRESGQVKWVYKLWLKNETTYQNGIDDPF